MRTTILPPKVLDVIKKSPAVYAVARGVRFKIGSILGSRTFEGVNGPVHYNDFMLTSNDPQHIEPYRKTGVDFADYLGSVLEKCGKSWESIDACYEVGCGYGRLQRAIVQKVDPKKVYVCDVLKEPADFVSKTFGVHKVGTHGAKDFPADKTFDLIWLYSVFTHLHDEQITEMIRDLSKLLVPGGALVFTTHGWPSANDAIKGYGEHWKMRQPEIIKAMNETGSYYERYSYYKDDIGMTWHTPERVAEIVAQAAPDLVQLEHRAPGLPDGHQDFYAYQKKA